MNNDYKKLTLEYFKETFEDIFNYSKPKFGFTFPLGKIGNTDAYRISDNHIVGKGEWEIFEQALKREAFRDFPIESKKYFSDKELLKELLPSRIERLYK